MRGVQRKNSWRLTYMSGGWGKGGLAGCCLPFCAQLLFSCVGFPSSCRLQRRCFLVPRVGRSTYSHTARGRDPCGRLRAIVSVIVVARVKGSVVLLAPAILASVGRIFGDFAASRWWNYAAQVEVVS